MDKNINLPIWMSDYFLLMPRQPVIIVVHSFIHVSTSVFSCLSLPPTQPWCSVFSLAIIVHQNTSNRQPRWAWRLTETFCVFWQVKNLSQNFFIALMDVVNRKLVWCKRTKFKSAFVVTTVRSFSTTLDGRFVVFSDISFTSSLFITKRIRG